MNNLTFKHFYGIIAALFIPIIIIMIILKCNIIHIIFSILFHLFNAIFISMIFLRHYHHTQKIKSGYELLQGKSHIALQNITLITLCIINLTKDLSFVFLSSFAITFYIIAILYTFVYIFIIQNNIYINKNSMYLIKYDSCFDTSSLKNSLYDSDKQKLSFVINNKDYFVHIYEDDYNKKIRDI